MTPHIAAVWALSGGLGQPSSVAAAPASASDPQLAVSPVVVGGDVDPLWAGSLGEALARGLGRVTLPTHQLPPQPGRCDASCWADLARAEGYDIVIRTVVFGRERLYEIEIEARDATDGSLLLTSKEPCQPCGRVEVEDQLARQAGALAERLRSLDRSPAVVVVAPQPTGGEVRAPAPAPPPRDWRRPAGWSLLGVGVPALATGIAFVALHHRPYTGRCTGEDHDPARDLCRYRWNSLTPGATLIALGGAFATSGVAMLVLARRSARPQPSRRLRSRAHRGGVGLRLAPDFAAGGIVVSGWF